MHIPDGYLSPIVSVGMGVATVPAWGIAAEKAKRILDNRTIPLLAIFSALSFTIMMFNIPVPGGTTAHGVGATLIAIVLGPWAAVIAVSTALVIQALFFGDGGILAIFANCFSMAVVMPFVGYWLYRLLAARAPLLATRRAWAAGIAGYLAITAGALVVGILLGIEPLFFTDAGGRPLYSPYDLQAAIPAMLVAHLFGAAIVEGLVTGLGVAWFQKRHPEYLTLRGAFAGEDVALGEAGGRPMWQVVAGTVGAVAVALAAIGLVLGGGDPARLFGSDWTAVDWPAVATMLVLVAAIFAVLVPIAYVVLPRPVKRVGAAFAAVAVLAPLGLIAPGFAYGEGSVEDLGAAFGYVPRGLQDLSRVFSAPLSGYNIQLPFFDRASPQLWHAAVGYEITGILGILLCGGAVLGISRLVARGRSAERGPDAPAGVSNEPSDQAEPGAARA